MSDLKYTGDPGHDMMKSIRELEAEVERLKADGERLDWLDQWIPGGKMECFDLIMFWIYNGQKYSDGLRAAIDAAREEEG